MSYKDFVIPVETRNKYLLRRFSDLANMQSAIKAGDFELLARVSHNWKGHGVTYGFPEIGVWGAQIEMDAKEKKLDSLNVILNEVNNFLSKKYPLR